MLEKRGRQNGKNSSSINAPRLPAFRRQVLASGQGTKHPAVNKRLEELPDASKAAEGKLRFSLGLTGSLPDTGFLRKPRAVDKVEPAPDEP